MSIQEQALLRHTHKTKKQIPDHYAYMPVGKVGKDQKYLYGFFHCEYGNIDQVECCALHLETM